MHTSDPDRPSDRTQTEEMVLFLCSFFYIPGWLCFLGLFGITCILLMPSSPRYISQNLIKFNLCSDNLDNDY